MSYVMEPELPWKSLAVWDCGEGDHSWSKRPDPSGPAEACFVGIIDGTDGPTTILLANGKTGHSQTACSALRFEPP